MKKVMLTTITYGWPDTPKDENGIPVQLISRNKLVVINSSKNADPNHDIRAAIDATSAWFAKSVMSEQGAKYASITAEDTILADNPEPPALYTEADLVSFGNFMSLKIVGLSNGTISPHLNSTQVWDSDLANWRDNRKPQAAQEPIENQNPWRPYTDVPHPGQVVECREFGEGSKNTFRAYVRWSGSNLNWVYTSGYTMNKSSEFEWREAEKNI